jgi:hypothetical protein
MKKLLISALLLMSACASAPKDANLDGFLRALEGRFDNSAQFASAPEAMKKPPVAGGDYEWIDQQHGIFARVTAPQIGPHVLYVEWRKATASGEISRQRIWSFRTDETGQVRMDYFAFKSPAAFAGKASAPAAFAALTPGELIGYGPACALRVTDRGRGAFDARIDREECQITSQSGRTMALEVRLTAMPTGILYEEAGILPDGAYAFKVPNGAPYDLRRLP